VNLEPSSTSPGAGTIRVAAVAGRSVPITLRSASPLRLLSTTGEPAPWIFATTFGGGLVDGDRIALDVELEGGAAAVLATPASPKVYRSARGTGNFVDARVGEGALLAVLPDPIVCFAGARFEQRSRFELARGAELVFLDVLTAGRVARDERWAFASHRAELVVRREGLTLLRDSTRLDPAHGALATRMGRFDVLGTLVLAGSPALRAHVAEQITGPVARDAPIVESSSARDDVLLVRFAAHEIEPLLARVRALLEPLFPRVGDPFARKR
jgi:urease accessory protein